MNKSITQNHRIINEWTKNTFWNRVSKFVNVIEGQDVKKRKIAKILFI